MESLFKFAFVRNPYTWMYSWYRFRQRPELRNPDHPHHARYAGGQDFDEFMETFNEGQIFLKQSDFLYSHGGELLVDFVGRYEFLQTDFDKVCERLELPATSLQQVNVSDGDDFDPATISGAARERIHHHFRRDFELFGYEMLP